MFLLFFKELKLIINFVREHIETNDGGSFTLDWYGFEKNYNNDGETPIIVVMPGATGEY